MIFFLLTNKVTVATESWTELLQDICDVEASVEKQKKLLERKLKRVLETLELKCSKPARIFYSICN